MQKRNFPDQFSELVASNFKELLLKEHKFHCVGADSKYDGKLYEKVNLTICRYWRRKVDNLIKKPHLVGCKTVEIRIKGNVENINELIENVGFYENMMIKIENDQSDNPGMVKINSKILSLCTKNYFPIFDAPNLKQVSIKIEKDAQTVADQLQRLTSMNPSIKYINITNNEEKVHFYMGRLRLDRISSDFLLDLMTRIRTTIILQTRDCPAIIIERIMEGNNDLIELISDVLTVINISPAIIRENVEIVEIRGVTPAPVLLTNFLVRNFPNSRIIMVPEHQQ